MDLEREALNRHEQWRGKMEVVSRVQLDSKESFPLKMIASGGAFSAECSVYSGGQLYFITAKGAST